MTLRLGGNAVELSEHDLIHEQQVFFLAPFLPQHVKIEGMYQN